MLSRIRNHKSLGRALWLAVALFGVPAVAYAANYILNSGEWVGLGSTSGRIVFTEKGDIDDITTRNGDVIVRDGDVGINVTTPGQKLHLGDGNFLIEGGGETAVKIKRDVTYSGGPSGISQNPIFELGRIIQAGDGDPEFRFLYSDDSAPERSVLEFDRKGIVASVKQDRGSHFEGFISGDDPEPIFRLNSYPKMRLEMGNGGSTPVDVAIQRETTSTLTFLTRDVESDAERIRIDSDGIEVSEGYLKLDTSSGTPPSDDCDSADEVGRMKVDSFSPILYVCTTSGWGKAILGVTYQYLPSVHRR
jgi:hypothetical protein